MTRILTLLVAALLVGGVVTAVVKEPTPTQESGLSAPPIVPDETFDPNASPLETMTFDGPAPFETPTTRGPTTMQTGGLPVTGGTAAWPPALASVLLALVAGLRLRRAGT